MRNEFKIFLLLYFSLLGNALYSITIIHNDLIPIESKSGKSYNTLILPASILNVPETEKIVGLKPLQYASYFSTAFNLSSKRSNNFSTLIFPPQFFELLGKHTNDHTASICNGIKSIIKDSPEYKTNKYFSEKNQNKLVTYVKNEVESKFINVNLKNIGLPDSVFMLIPDLKKNANLNLLVKRFDAIMLMHIEVEKSFIPGSFSTKYMIIVIRTRDYLPILYIEEEGPPGIAAGGQVAAAAFGTLAGNPLSDLKEISQNAGGEAKVKKMSKFAYSVSSGVNLNGIFMSGTINNSAIKDQTLGIIAGNSVYYNFNDIDQIQVGVYYSKKGIKYTSYTSKRPIENILALEFMEFPIIWAPGFSSKGFGFRLHIGVNMVKLISAKIENKDIESKLSVGEQNITSDIKNFDAQIVIGIAPEYSFSKSLSFFFRPSINIGLSEIYATNDTKWKNTGFQFLSGVIYGFY